MTFLWQVALTVQHVFSVENAAFNVHFYFRFSTVWHNRLRNKHLTEYLRNSGNELETVRFSAICGAMLSNNSFLLQR